MWIYGKVSRVAVLRVCLRFLDTTHHEEPEPDLLEAPSCELRHA
jgi:hypothetical protein